MGVCCQYYHRIPGLAEIASLRWKAVLCQADFRFEFTVIHPIKHTLQCLPHPLLLILENQTRLKIPSLQLILARKQIYQQLCHAVRSQPAVRGTNEQELGEDRQDVWPELLVSIPQQKFISRLGEGQLLLQLLLATTGKGLHREPVLARNRITVLEESSQLTDWVSLVSLYEIEVLSI